MGNTCSAAAAEKPSPGLRLQSSQMVKHFMPRLKGLARASCERKVATCQGHDELPRASGHGSLILFYFFGLFYEPHAGFPEWLMTARASAHYLYCSPCEKTHTHTHHFSSPWEDNQNHSLARISHEGEGRVQWAVEMARERLRRKCTVWSGLLTTSNGIPTQHGFKIKKRERNVQTY